MSEECCAFNKCNLGGKCDRQHKCPDCLRYIHAICGCCYYDKATGEPVDNLSFPRKCFECFAKNRYKKSSDDDSSAKKTTTPSTSKRSKKLPKNRSASKDPSKRTKDATPAKSSSKSKKNSSQSASKSTSKNTSKSSAPRSTNIKNKGDDRVSKEASKRKKDKTPTKKSSTKPNSNTSKNPSKTPPPRTASKTPSKPSSTPQPSNKNKPDDNVLVINKNLWTEQEREKYKPGFYMDTDLKKGEIVLNRFSHCAPGVHANTRIIGKMITMPAMYWGEELLKTKWWTTPSWNKDLNKITMNDMRSKVILHGKVLGQSTKSNVYDVAFVANILDDEVSIVKRVDVKRFVVIDNPKEKDKSSPSRRTRNSIGDDSDDDDDDLVEIDEFGSEEELQEDDDEASTSEEEEDKEEDLLWVRKESRVKIDRVWVLCDDHKTTQYTRPITPSFVNNMRQSDWESITPYELFLLQVPEGEFDLWSELTSKELAKKKHDPVDLNEMKAFVGCLFAFTQSSKVGGIRKAFEQITDGLFPAQDLGRFGLNYRRFCELLSAWTFAALPQDKLESDMDAYWRTDQLVDRYNSHYAKIFTHGTYLNVDERISWFFGRKQPEGVKTCDRKPRGTGQEFKTLSACDCNVTTTFEQVRGNKDVSEGRDYVKEYGKAAAVVLRLCEKVDAFGSGRIVIADSWFANLSLFRGLRSKGLHMIGMIKTGNAGFPKKGLCMELEKEDVIRGSHATARSIIDEERVIALAWRGKSDKGNKGKKKTFWMSTFLASDCTTTLPGTPAEKKRHTITMEKAPSVFVPRPKLVEDYYNGMPGTDIVNRNAQFLIGMEGSVRTTDVNIRMATTILSTWMANSYGMAMKFLPHHKKNHITTANFVRDVILGGLFQLKKGADDRSRSVAASASIAGSSISSIAASRSSPFIAHLPITVPTVVVGQNRLPTIIDSHAIDPYVHTMQKLSEVGGIGR